MIKELRDAAKALLASQKVVLAAHVNPDGDTLGSILALTHALLALGKSVTPLSADGVPLIYQWMPGADLVKQDSGSDDFDLAVICDAGKPDRAGSKIQAILENTRKLMIIDHHMPEGNQGDLRLIDPGLASNAELVWKVICELERQSGMHLRSCSIAECILTGIITDTGSFQYPNTTARTFLAASRMQRLGAKPSHISELVFENRSVASVRLLGRVLSAMTISENGKVAWGHVTASDFAEMNATDADTEGIVAHLRAIYGVQVGILFREIPGKKLRVSLRAREGSDVNAVARAFGGGGHKLAAGCSFDQPLQVVEPLVVNEALKHVLADSK